MLQAHAIGIVVDGMRAGIGGKGLNARVTAYAAIMAFSALKTEASDVHHISVSEPDNDQPAAIYNIGGVRMQHMQRGLNIVRTPDGKVRKYFVPR